MLLLSCFSCVRLCATPKTAAHQAPLSLGFSRQEHWSGLPFPSPMHESEKWKWSHSVVSNSSRPHGLQPTRLICPWDFPGKSTGVGCYFLLQIHELSWSILFNFQILGDFAEIFLLLISNLTLFCSKNFLCMSWFILWLSGKELACQCRRCGFNLWVREIP